MAEDLDSQYLQHIRTKKIQPWKIQQKSATSVSSINVYLPQKTHLDLLADLDFFIFRFLLSILSQVYPVGIAKGSDSNASGHCCCDLLLLDRLLLLLLSHEDDDDHDENRLSGCSSGGELFPLLKKRGLDIGV